MLAGRGLGADRPLPTAWCRQFCAQAAEATRPKPYREHVLPFKGALPLASWIHRGVVCVLESSEIITSILCVFCTLLPGFWPLELPPCLHLRVLAKVRAPEEYTWVTQQHLAYVV